MSSALKGSTEVRSIGIRYGVMCETIEEQLKNQGFKFNPKEVEAFERCRNAIHVLQFNNMLFDSQTSKLFNRLNKQVTRHVCKENKLTFVK